MTFSSVLHQQNPTDFWKSCVSVTDWRIDGLFFDVIPAKISLVFFFSS